MSADRQILVFVSAVAVAACSVDSNAIVPNSDAAVGDATGDSVPPDGSGDALIDAGPPCTELAAEPSVLAVVGGDALGAAPGVDFQDTEIEEPGVIALAGNAYRYGYWAFYGHEETVLADPPNLADLDGSTPVAAAFRDDVDESLSAGEAPHDLLVDRDDVYTVEVIGEILLEAGDTEVHLDVDDAGVLSIDVEGTAFTVRRSGAGESSVTVSVATAGWYPLGAAWQNEGGPGRFRVEITPPDGSRRLPTPSEMRTDALSLRGREVIGWESRDPDRDPVGSRIDLDETDWSDSGGGPYEGVGIDTDDNWSIRFFGRRVFPDPIDDIRIRSDDSHRVWVDGVFLGDDYGGSANEGYDTPAPDGTVDVVTELSEGSGGSDLRYQLDEMVVQVDDLRPGTRFGGTPHGVGELFSHSVSDTRTETLDLSIVPSDLPSAVEVSVVVEADEPELVTVTVTEPGGMMHSESLANGSWSRDGGVWLLRWVPPWAEDLDSVSGEWEITVDNAASSSVRWEAQGILAHIGGVAEPYAAEGTYQSTVVDLGDEAEVTGVRAGGMWNGLTSVGLAIRAGATPSEVMGQPFVDTDAVGDLAAPQRGRFVQVRATLSGPGWDTPRIRDLRIFGRGCLRCAEVDPTTCPEARTSDGLVALWRFDEGGGNVVRDVSGFLVHDLITPSNATFTWETDHVNVETGRFTLDRPIDALIDVFEASNALTLEAWVRPANDSQDGPARILTISTHTTSQSLVLGQDATLYLARIRREGASDGMPHVFSADPSVNPGLLQHVVVTRTPSGEQRIWVDGVQSGDPVTAAEPLTNWDPAHRVYVANEGTDDRQWAGELHLLALYDRALSAEEIARHQRIGP